MAVEARNDTWDCSHRLEANGVMVIFLAKEGMDKDTHEPHHSFGALINKIFWLVVERLANFLQILYRETRWKGL